MKQLNIENWQTIGKRLMGRDEQIICEVCSQDEVGEYYDIENKETGETILICWKCHEPMEA